MNTLPKLASILLPIQRQHLHLSALRAGTTFAFQAYNPDYSFHIDLAQLDDDDWSELKVNLENPGLHTIWHNANFDLRVMQACGINVGGHVDDTMLMSYLLTNGQVVPTRFKSNVSLAAVVFREIGRELPKELQAQDWMNADLNEQDLAYAMADVRYTWQVFCRWNRKSMSTIWPVFMRLNSRLCIRPCKWNRQAYTWTSR